MDLVGHCTLRVIRGAMSTILYPANLAYAVAQRAAGREKDGIRSVSMRGLPGFGRSKEKAVVRMKNLGRVCKTNKVPDQIRILARMHHSCAFISTQRV